MPEQRPGFVDLPVAQQPSDPRAADHELLVTTGSTFSTRNPLRVPSDRRREKLPFRSRPNRKFVPTQTSETWSQPTSTSCTNWSGSHCEISGVKRTMATAVDPAAAMAVTFWSIVISSGGAFSGRTIRGGWGSKVRMAAVALRSSARRRTSSTIFRCPDAGRRNCRGPARVGSTPSGARRRDSE